jgi:hypothetical protein
MASIFRSPCDEQADVPIEIRMMWLLAIAVGCVQVLSLSHVSVAPGEERNQDAGLDLEALAREFETSRPPARERLYERLAGLGSAEAEARLASALELRWTRALAVLSNKSVQRQLEPIVELRKRLDSCRGEALDRIRRAGSSQDASTRDESQALIQYALEHVRRLWNSKAYADVPKSFRVSVEELVWNQDRQADRGLGFVDRLDVPEWLLSLDSNERWLTVQTFAWNQTERALQKENRRIADRNYIRLSPCVGPRDPSPAERDVVEIVNEYRNMFGLPAWWWSKDLQKAAVRGSPPGPTGDPVSDDCVDMGVATDPELLPRYSARACELWSTLNADPEAVFRAWCNCAESHAVLLAKDWREMACSEQSGKWILLIGSADPDPR